MDTGAAIYKHNLSTYTISMAIAKTDCILACMPFTFGVGFYIQYNNAPANHEVWKQAFWMMHYGSVTPKRSVLWSNSKKIIKFRTPRLRRKYKVKKALVKKYKNRRGENKFQGNDNMSKSGMLSFSGRCVQILS